MKSHEVIRQAVDEPGVKAVAAALKISAALIYKWCEPIYDATAPDQSGAKNPLDRVIDLHRITKDERIVRWICNEAGGFFVQNPLTDSKQSRDEVLFQQTRNMMRDFSELLDAVSGAHANDGRIDAKESDVIRQRWEDLKALAERFVVSCEKGRFH